MKEIIIIAAAGEQNELGLNGTLPWHLPNDFKHFKNQTLGHPMIMGRKTFESFPKPLPGRIHIIITREQEYTVSHADCFVAHSLEAGLEMFPALKKTYIIGGGEIYNQAMNIATHLELTRVHGTFEADTFFPKINPKCWKLVNSIEHQSDSGHPFAYSFQSFIKTC
jgi:dihydrofolate reductase